MSTSDTSDDDGVSTVGQYEARLAECEAALRAAHEQLDAGGALAALGLAVEDGALAVDGGLR